ncbi:MAG: hypothetical protein QXO17_07640 [Nitrososphaerota archaeon]
MKELPVYMIKCGVAVVIGYVSALVTVLSHWTLTLPIAVAAYVAVTLALMGPMLRDEPNMTNRRAWTVGVGAYTAFWLLSWLAFYNALL